MTTKFGLGAEIHRLPACLLTAQCFILLGKCVSQLKILSIYRMGDPPPNSHQSSVPPQGDEAPDPLCPPYLQTLATLLERVCYLLVHGDGSFFGDRTLLTMPVFLCIAYQLACEFLFCFASFSDTITSVETVFRFYSKQGLRIRSIRNLFSERYVRTLTYSRGLF